MTAPLGREQTLETLPDGTVIHRVYELSPGRTLRNGTEFTTESGYRCVFRSAETRPGKDLWINATSLGGQLVMVHPTAVRTVHRKTTRKDPTT